MSIGCMHCEYGRTLERIDADIKEAANLLSTIRFAQAVVGPQGQLVSLSTKLDLALSDLNALRAKTVEFMGQMSALQVCSA